MPKISVVVTVWNLEDYIVQALESLESQTTPPFEVLIIDDGSIDSSKELIKRFTSRNKNWFLFPLTHNGVSFARNFALSKVQGDYVLFLDGDDFYQFNILERLSSSLDQRPDIVAFRCFELDDFSQRLSEANWTIKTKLGKEKFKRSILYSFVGWPWDKLFKVSFLRKHNLYFPTLENSEDLLFVYPALFLSGTTLVVDEYLITHRMNRNSSLSNSIEKSQDAFYSAILQLEEFLKNNNFWRDNQQCFQEWSIDLTFWATKNQKIAFDVLKNRYPKIDWQLKSTDYSFFHYQRFLLKVAELTQCSGFIWFLSYNLYKCRKFGLKRTIFLILISLSRNIGKAFPIFK